MKKKKVKSRSVRSVHRSSSTKTIYSDHVYGVDKNFILIVGGAFILIVFGMMLFT